MSMKIVNLNKFSTKQRVQLDGKEYTVKGKPVGQFIEDDLQARLAEAMDAKSRVKLMVEECAKISDIPKDLLLKQEIGVLNAILMVSQGVDPDKPEEVEESGKK